MVCEPKGGWRHVARDRAAEKSWTPRLSRRTVAGQRCKRSLQAKVSPLAMDNLRTPQAGLALRIVCTVPRRSA